jgi:fatty acid desaturase
MTPNELSASTKESTVPAASAARGNRPLLEFRTLLLIAATYAGWLVVTYSYSRWSLLAVAPLTAFFITLQSSLQHEAVHGHPTRSPRLNRLLVIPSLSLWLPYDCYRASHHKHHIDARLTDPLDDPESYYWREEDLARLPALWRVLLQAQQTLAGRVVIGAFWTIGSFFYSETRALWRNEKGLRALWLGHLAWCVPVIVWVKLVCGIPLWIYLLTMAVPANAVQLMRSFAEHRARPTPPERIAIVEGSWILGPIFLFNNLHLLHHESPGIPWYELPARYRLARERLIAANGGLVYKTYFDVARRYLFSAHDKLLHPTGGVPRNS